LCEDRQRVVEESPASARIYEATVRVSGESVRAIAVEPNTFIGSSKQCLNTVPPGLWMRELRVGKIRVMPWESALQVGQQRF
jgi:hypothetical protein